MSCKTLLGILNFKENKENYTPEEREKIITSYKKQLHMKACDCCSMETTEKILK